MSIAGFQHPEAGRIAIGDETFVDAARKIAVRRRQRNLGIVFQSYAVWPHMTVFENLAFPLKVRKLKREAIRTRVREVLELVEMDLGSATRTSCPAASSSASRWRGRSSTRRRPLCSTSRSRTSTRSSASVRARG